MLSRMQQWLDGVRGYDSYAYGKMKFRIPKKKCDDLRRAVGTVLSLRKSYVEKCKDGQRRMIGFHRDIQNANIMVLREFDRVCAARGLVYMLYGGTLLGAQRHTGMIPWDDDIDVAMPRRHYEKIIDVFNAESHIPSLRARLVSPSRGFVFVKVEAIREPMIYIDIFPCDCYADMPGPALNARMGDFRRRIAGQVLPDKNPAATYQYFTASRNGLGLTPVAHDDPECHSVIADFDCSGSYIFASKDIFPCARMDFEGRPMPVPANPSSMLKAMYGGYEMLPIYSKSHLQDSALTVERMLNVKRFLRSDPLRFTEIPPRRMDMVEKRWDRFLTRVRRLASPVFNVVTRETLKEYRIFSKKILRLRPDRLMLGHLEMIEMYTRLLQEEMPAPCADGALRQSQAANGEALAGVFRVCEGEGLTCWLWAGSLLGAIRGGTFLHTDNEAALLMPRADYERFRPLYNAFADRGGNGLRAELALLHGGVATIVTGGEKPTAIVIPCDSCPDDWERNDYARHMANAAHRAAIESFTARNDPEGLYRHYAAARERMGIGLDDGKSRSIFPGWDCPELFEKCHVLAAKHYKPPVKRVFEGVEVPVPADHDIVLTSLYGDYQSFAYERFSRQSTVSSWMPLRRGLAFFQNRH